MFFKLSVPGRCHFTSIQTVVEQHGLLTAAVLYVPGRRAVYVSQFPLDESPTLEAAGMWTDSALLCWDCAGPQDIIVYDCWFPLAEPPSLEANTLV